ncbi:MAG: hypothetical protein K2M76_02100 [Muribaculaceae bacterium]|nr:hypothetical protein [Muribaculaceae bacterium]
MLNIKRTVLALLIMAATSTVTIAQVLDSVPGFDGKVTAVSATGKTLQTSTYNPKRHSQSVKGMMEGDWLLFSKPSKALPAGTDVDFMITISAADSLAPRTWVCEILDGGEWHAATPDEQTSFYTINFNPYQHATCIRNFTLKHPMDSGDIKVRCRVVGHSCGGKVYMPLHTWVPTVINAYPGIKRKDSKRLAILGNSFTYYYGTPFLLTDIARSQGHRLVTDVHVKGGRHFWHHLELERSQDVTDKSGYDMVLLQDYSIAHSDYAANQDSARLDATRKLSEIFRAKSPKARIILENTWIFPRGNWSGYGSPEKFSEQLQKGAQMLAAECKDIDRISPIRVAFDMAYAEGIDGLWVDDKKHQGLNGAYLKACVNYLMLYGGSFNKNVPDCGIDPDTAAALRRIAAKAVKSAR